MKNIIFYTAGGLSFGATMLTAASLWFGIPAVFFMLVAIYTFKDEYDRVQ